MSLSAAVIRELIAAGLEGEALAAACERIEASDLAKKQPTANALRQRRFRERKAQEVDGERYGNVTVTPKEPLSPTPPNQETIPPSPPKGGHSPHGFDRFWSMFPNKVGKAAAAKAFAAALKRTDLDTMLQALEAYANKRDDRPWCNPATWLNQDRWNDAPARVVPIQRATAPPPRQQREHFNQPFIESFAKIAAGAADGNPDHDEGTVPPRASRADRIDPGPNVLDLAVASRRQDR